MMKLRITLVISAAASATILLIGWHIDPSFRTVPTPRKTIFYSIAAYIFASLLIFSVNAILACFKGRLAKTEEELESIVAPALKGHECDDRIMKLTEIPRVIICGVSLGGLCGTGIHYLLK